MTDTLTTQDFANTHGAPVYSKDGDRIGTVDRLYLDIDTGRPEWIGIGAGFLRMKGALVPVEGSTFEGDGVRVPYDGDHVKASPDIDEERISQRTEAELASHYGLSYGEDRSRTGLPESGNGRTGTSGGEMKVAERDTGRLRLHRWVEAEPVETDVELR